MNKIMKVMCELMERDSRGEYEYTYELSSDNGNQEQDSGQKAVETEHMALLP